MRSAALGLFALAVGGAGLACQSYNMEGVDPQTVVAVETSGNFTAGKAPALLVVQDRSGSMEICFGDGGSGGQQCDTDGGGRDFRPGSSRMHVSQRVMSNVVGAHGEDVYFGLMLYGVDGPDPACGDPLEVVLPGQDASAAVGSAYENHEAILDPAGGTPTTRALDRAYEMLVDAETGMLLMPERDNYVVLVTDGLMNCNLDLSMPCVCANDSGCPILGGGVADLGDEGTFGITAEDSRYCLDDSESIAAVERLRQAGVNTFVIGLGESFSGGGSDLGVSSLDALAEAGGVPRSDAGEKFYSAADEQQLESALNDIVNKIVVPCEYELDGPVCDGRLLQVNLSIDGEAVSTSCGAEESGWQFAEGAGGRLDERRITFSQDLCRRFEEADSVQISIKGVESGCEYADGEPVGPACDLRAFEADL